MKKKQRELFSLMSAQHDGLLDEASCERLAERLAGDKEAQRYYLELGNMFHELEETFHGHTAETIVEEFPSKRAKIIPMLGWVTAIAASLLVAFLFVPTSGTDYSGLLVDSESTVITSEQIFVARVIESSDLVWGADNSVAIHGDELEYGMLDMEGGNLTVELDNGARFGFVGPVKMDFSSPGRLALESGAVAVDLSGYSEGLTVSTPDTVLVANTVRAHIQCAAGKATEVNVERGALDLYTEDAKGVEIHKSVVANEAVLVARGTDLPIKDTKIVTEPRIDLSLPSELENLQYAHYSFDESASGVVKNTGQIPNADGWLCGIAAYPEFPRPRRVPSRFGRALEFTGHGEGMLADLKEFGSDEPGSVAFWIKMDPDTVPAAYENIFSWHMYRNAEKTWHAADEKEQACKISINHLAEQGVVGAVWIAFRDKWICGSKDLRDGRWHHVTAVFHRGYQGTMVRHYIDGQLARSSARGETWYPRERYPDIGGGSIAIGRVFWPERPDSLSETDSVGLRGMVDEVYVFNQPVLPSHASSLYMKNVPNQVLDISFVPWIPRTVGMIPFAR